MHTVITQNKFCYCYYLLFFRNVWELIRYQVNFIQFLNKLFKGGWRWKNAETICYMLTSLVYLQQGNVKKCKKQTQIVNIDEKNLHIFPTTWGILIKFPRRKCLIKSERNQGYTLSLENTVLEKPQRGQIDPTTFFRINAARR